MVPAQGEEPVVKIQTETIINQDGGTRIISDLEVHPSGPGTGYGEEPCEPSGAAGPVGPPGPVGPAGLPGGVLTKSSIPLSLCIILLRWRELHSLGEDHMS